MTKDEWIDLQVKELMRRAQEPMSPEMWAQVRALARKLEKKERSR